MSERSSVFLRSHSCLWMFLFGILAVIGFLGVIIAIFVFLPLGFFVLALCFLIVSLSFLRGGLIQIRIEKRSKNMFIWYKNEIMRIGIFMLLLSLTMVGGGIMWTQIPTSPRVDIVFILGMECLVFFVTLGTLASVAFMHRHICELRKNALTSVTLTDEANYE